MLQWYFGQRTGVAKLSEIPNREKEVIACHQWECYDPMCDCDRQVNEKKKDPPVLIMLYHEGPTEV